MEQNFDTQTVLDAHRREETVRSWEETLALRRNMAAKKTKDAGSPELDDPDQYKAGKFPAGPVASGRCD
jgi:hypothetical protein